MPNTFMAVAMDLPDNGSPFGSIHPRDKDDVATRLVAGSLNVAYGRNIAFQGPFPLSLVRSEQNHVVLTYPNDQKLHVTEQGSFQVCCTAPCNISEPTPSPSWTWTPIISHQHPAITIDTRACINSGGKAEMIRYAWSLTPCEFKKCSVYNDQGFPAPPFVLPVSDMKL
uniref:Sialate O-acetylesterase domain-containing protein n=1 Tax=Ciona savignyi TaxID=51511 RepID=H2ZGF7_CIOSA